MMKTALVVILMVTVAWAQPPQETPSTCASVLCIALAGTVCKEVLNPTTGIIQGQCLNNYIPTGNENVCSSGQPLFVQSASGTREAFCGRGLNRITCPTGYSCNVHPTDAYAVCCPNNNSGNKPGTCRAPQPGEVGICAFTCQQDGECPGDQKCCRTACGGTSCASPETQAVQTCDANPCGPEQTCSMIQPQCFTTPCPQIAQCTDVPRAGVCPKPRFFWYYLWTRRRCQKDCEKDSDCKGYSKCCKDYSGCGTTCEFPEPANTCANTRCDQGTICQMQQVQCIRAPCFDVPNCVDAASLCSPACTTGFQCQLSRPWYCTFWNFNCNPRPTCVRVATSG